MSVDFADIVLAALERRASDIHLTAGAPPPHQGPGAAAGAGGLPCAGCVGHARDRLLDHERHAAPAVREPAPGRFQLLGSAHREDARQRLSAAGRGQRGIARHPGRDQVPGGARNAAGGPGDGLAPPRHRARHRADRLGQVHHAGGADRRDQHHPRRPHPHDRGSDRVPARVTSAAWSTSASWAAMRRASPTRLRAALRAGPGRDPGRRDARPGDDLDGADGGRDRTPRARDAAHPGCAADDRPRDRRLPAPPAAARAGDALGRAAGCRGAAAAADRRRLRPRPRGRGAGPDSRRCAT